MDQETEFLSINKSAMEFLGGYEFMQKTLREEIKKATRRNQYRLSIDLLSKINEVLNSDKPITQDFYETIAFPLKLSVNALFRVPQDSGLRQKFIEDHHLVVDHVQEADIFDTLICMMALNGLDDNIKNL